VKALGKLEGEHIPGEKSSDVELSVNSAFGRVAGLQHSIDAMP
jgi:hypothetical protein